MKIGNVTGNKSSSGLYNRANFITRLRRLLTEYELVGDENADEEYPFFTWLTAATNEEKTID